MTYDNEIKRTEALLEGLLEEVRNMDIVDINRLLFEYSINILNIPKKDETEREAFLRSGTKACVSLASSLSVNFLQAHRDEDFELAKRITTLVTETLVKTINL